MPSASSPSWNKEGLSVEGVYIVISLYFPVGTIFPCHRLYLRHLLDTTYSRILLQYVDFFVKSERQSRIG